MLSRGSMRLAVRARAWMPTQQEWTLAAQCVQPEEKERIGKFVFKKDAKSAMVGRLLIRRVVSSMLGVPYRSVKLARTDRGKPYVVNTSDQVTPRPGCSFNISHQGDLVVIAAEPDRQVGVDIMKVEWTRGASSVQDFLGTMERQLTPQEWSSVRRRKGDMEQLAVFYRHWCLKESLVKALGTGIGFEVSRLDFDTRGHDLNPRHVTRSTKVKVDGMPAPDWTFEETLIEEHCVAVATRPLGKEVQVEPSTGTQGTRFTLWSIQELLEGCDPLTGSEPDPAYWDNFNNRQEAPGKPVVA